MNKYLIAGNWKMNKNIAEAKDFAEQLKNNLPKNPKETAIIAPFTQLAQLKESLKGTGVLVGAQNVFFEESGAYTGEISIGMLEELEVDLCVIGHSERRQYFAESDEMINKKLSALLTSTIRPILCVGENLETREAGREEEFVTNQIEEDFKDISSVDASKVVIAYEPIWAIGTGKTATADQAETMCKIIRDKIAKMYDLSVASEVIIQYGGSVKPNNSEEILGMSNINGALVGGASLDPNSFTDICNSVKQE